MLPIFSSRKGKRLNETFFFNFSYFIVKLYCFEGLMRAQHLFVVVVISDTFGWSHNFMIKLTEPHTLSQSTFLDQSSFGFYIWTAKRPVRCICYSKSSPTF